MCPAPPAAAVTRTLSPGNINPHYGKRVETINSSSQISGCENNKLIYCTVLNRNIYQAFVFKVCAKNIICFFMKLTSSDKKTK